MNFLRYNLIAFLLGLTVTASAQLNQTYLAYIDKYKNLAIEQMKLHRIPASITLAQALLESGAGTSMLATKANNHFGIKCHSDWKGESVYKDDDEKNDCFRKYKSVKDSYEDHSKFLERSRYERLYTYDPLDYKAWARGLRECGYATLATYDERLVKLIEQYQLYQYDKATGSSKHHKSDAASFVNHNHQPYLVNDIVCYRAVAGEDWDNLSKELGIKKKKLLKYNECDESFTQIEGMNIFTKKKRNKADAKYKGFWHSVQPGESMYSIAQLYGVKVAQLYKMNFKGADYMPASGDLLRVTY